MGAIVERTCVICRAKKRKDELFRFLVVGSEVVFDKEQNGIGRGFYICSKQCWENAVKKKRKIRIGSDARKARNIALPEKEFEEIVKV